MVCIKESENKKSELRLFPYSNWRIVVTLGSLVTGILAKDKGVYNQILGKPKFPNVNYDWL